MNIWRWIISIVGVVLVVVALNTTAVKNFFSDVSNSLSGLFNAVIDAPDRARLTGLQTSFMRNNMSLKPHQTDYVFEVTASIENVRSFHVMYCVSKDKNPYLFGSNLMKFCSDIEQSDILTAK